MRAGRGPRQRIVTTIGKLPGLDKFGDVYIGLSLWKRLGLSDFAIVISLCVQVCIGLVISSEGLPLAKDRTQAHILMCFLALAMWRTPEQWMEASGLGTSPRKLLEEMREVRSMDVLLPTREKVIRLRVVSTAPRGLKDLFQRLRLPLPNRPKIIENVVQIF